MSTALQATAPTDRTAPAGGAPSSRRGHPGWVLALVCLGQFMVVLDVSVVNVALPAIRGSLHLSTSGLQWVVNAYTLAFGGFLLLGGRAADLFGRRRLFLLGLGLFTVASLAGGLAHSGTVLLVARAAQGLGGAVLAPATLTILTTTFTAPADRARALGAWSAVAGAGGATGALLGGVLTDLAGWRWILFINVPIGAAAIAAAVRLLPESKVEGRRAALDLAGAVLVTAGLMSLVYGIVSSQDHGWSTPGTWGPVVAAVVLLGAFLAHEARLAAAPLVPLRIFRSRTVSAANAAMLVVGASVFASWYFLSLYYQAVLHFSPLRAGLAFLPQTIAIIIGAQVSSRALSRYAPRTLVTIGPLISAAGLLWLSRITAHTHYWSGLFVPSVLVTLGVGLVFTPLAAAATTGVAAGDAGLASGLLNTTRQVGGALGLAALATLAQDRASSLPGGARNLANLTSGYARALFVAGLLALVASAAGRALPRRGTAAAAGVARGAEPVAVAD